MLVDYPKEWGKYFDRSKKQLRTFRKDTPAEIVEKAKEINKFIIEHAGKPFFHFEED